MRPPTQVLVAGFMGFKPKAKVDPDDGAAVAAELNKLFPTGVIRAG